MSVQERLITERIYGLSLLNDLNDIVVHAGVTGRLLELDYWHCAPVYDIMPAVNNTGIGNFPDAWYHEYFENKYRRSDPIVRLVITSNKPLIWHKVLGQLTSPEEQMVIKAAYKYHIKDGISFPVHGVGGYHGFVTWSRAHEIRFSVTQQKVFHLYSYLLHEKIEETFGISFRKSFFERALSQRERDVLLWVLEGKSNYEIGAILGISENTVKFHLKKLCRQFKVNTRIQAAIRALKHGALRE